MVSFEEIEIDPRTGEEVVVKQQQQAKESSPNDLPFVLTSPFWYVLILGGLSLCMFVAFGDIESYEQPTLFRIFLSLFYGRQLLIQLVFFAAFILHFIEALIVFLLCPPQSSTRILWVLQTFILGYPSLKSFFIQLEQYFGLNKKKKTN